MEQSKCQAGRLPSCPNSTVGRRWVLRLTAEPHPASPQWDSCCGRNCYHSLQSGDLPFSRPLTRNADWQSTFYSTATRLGGNTWLNMMGTYMLNLFTTITSFTLFKISLRRTGCLYCTTMGLISQVIVTIEDKNKQAGDVCCAINPACSVVWFVSFHSGTQPSACISIDQVC